MVDSLLWVDYYVNREYGVTSRSTFSVFSKGFLCKLLIHADSADMRSSNNKHVSTAVHYWRRFDLFLLQSIRIFNNANHCS